VRWWRGRRAAGFLSKTGGFTGKWPSERSPLGRTV